MQNNYNDKFNNILMNLLKEMYAIYGSPDLSASFDTTVQFDENQRIAGLKNLRVNDQPKATTNELVMLVEKLNTIAQELLSLPELYRVKECHFSVKSGGAMSMEPTYYTKACEHLWLGNGLWDGKTPEGQRTGGILFTCIKCNASATSEADIKQKGGTIDWENSKMKPAGYAK
jgi:hypothetical protein